MKRNAPLSTTAIALLAAVTLVACAAGSGDAAVAGRSGLASADPPSSEVLSPLIIRSVAPGPIPVRGTDGKLHVVYELEVMNAAPRAVTISKVESVANDAGGVVVAAIAGPDVVARSLIVGDYTIPPKPVTTVPAGRTALLIMDDVYADRSAIPATFVNRVEATFGAISPDQAEFANNFPERVSELGEPVRVSDRQPVVIGPPLTGDSWVAVNACCELSAHRGAMLPIGGRINASERYAVDWSRFDLSARPIVDLAKGTQATFRGDPNRNESYFTYDQPILAVADATVVTVVSDLPDAPPHVFLKGLTVDQLGGNHVVLDLGSGVYAFYAHLKPGSAAVKLGDHVKKGQVIGRTGNSGNTSESHLHFHLMDGPLPLTAGNLPFEIDRFTFQGTVTPDALLTDPPPGKRAGELPLIYSSEGF